jgi:hypothetical protein
MVPLLERPRLQKVAGNFRWENLSCVTPIMIPHITSAPDVPPPFHGEAGRILRIANSMFVKETITTSQSNKA